MLARHCVEDGLLGERPGARRGRHVEVLRVEIAQRGVQPGQPFPDAAPRHPQRLQRRCQRQRELDVGVFAAPPESGAQVVDLDVGLLDALLIVTACRRVEQRRDRCVVVAVTRPHCVGLAGFPEFFQGVLAYRLQQPVPRSAAAVVGDHQ